MLATSGLTLELILDSGDDLSQLLSRTLRVFLVCHMLVIMQRSLERLENIYVLMREPVSSVGEKHIDPLPGAS